MLPLPMMFGVARACNVMDRVAEAAYWLLLWTEAPVYVDVFACLLLSLSADHKTMQLPGTLVGSLHQSRSF